MRAADSDFRPTNSEVCSDVAITLFGSDLDVLRQKAEEIVRVVSQVKAPLTLKPSRLEDSLTCGLRAVATRSRASFLIRFRP